MRAALRAEYGIDLREVLETRNMHASDLADLVAWLPPGSVFWRSIGGPASLSMLEREIRENTFWIRVLEWRKRGKGEQPKRAPDPKWSWDRPSSSGGATPRKAAAYLARQQRHVQNE